MLKIDVKSRCNIFGKEEGGMYTEGSIERSP